MNEKPFVVDEFYGILYTAEEFEKSKDYYLRYFGASNFYGLVSSNEDDDRANYAMSALATQSLVNIAYFRPGYGQKLSSIILYYGYYWNAEFDSMDEVNALPEFPNMDPRICKYWDGRIGWACKNLQLDFKQPKFYKFVNLSQVDPDFIPENDNAEAKA